MSRNAHIRPDQIKAIVNAIHTWDEGKLTWDNLCALSKPILGYRPTRSGLNAHEDIQIAFSTRKKNLRLQSSPNTRAIGTLVDARRMLAARDSEISTLNHQIAEFRDKFDRWRYNAMTLDISIAALDKALPSGQTGV